MVRRSSFATWGWHAAAAALVATGCTVVDEPGSHGPERPPPSTVPTTAPAGDGSATVSAPLSCPSIDVVDEALPEAHRTALDEALRSPRFDGLDVSISIWIDGHGEVAAVDPDTPLNPASNQKLFTAMGAFALLAPDHRFVTEVHHDRGVLTLLAGGDPTLRLDGPHSLAALAGQVAASGVESVRVLGVDAGHFEFDREAAGWQDWHIPAYVGPLSAFTVNDNRHRVDDEFVHNPAAGNLEAFSAALRAAGVDVAGATLDPAAKIGEHPEGAVVASLRSAPISVLLVDMLTRSDNETAEAVLRELGDGSTAGGIAAVDASLDALCTGRTGVSGDGSGLSRADFRSSREWRSLLQAAASEPWGADFRAALPVAGRTGTLAGRLTGASTAGNVAAKTGSIIGGQALSGYALTSSGREMVFSIVVNGDPGAVRAARAAIDGAVAAAIG